MKIPTIKIWLKEKKFVPPPFKNQFQKTLDRIS